MFQQRYDYWKKQGYSDEDATMKADRESQVSEYSLKGENIGTRGTINNLRKGGLSNADIEESGVFEFNREKKMPSNLELLRYGPKWYRKKGYKLRGKETPEEEYKTVRTSAVERGLKTAGLTDTEITRLRRRK